MLKTKSIYDPIEAEDGLRVLVTRYWPRGVKKERSDLWFRDLGPRPSLIKAWKSAQITWPEFTSLYMSEFESSAKRDALDKAASMIKNADEAARGEGQSPASVTLLCTCRDGNLCHRILLKDILEREKGF